MPSETPVPPAPGSGNYPDGDAVEIAWIAFVNAARSLLVAQSNDRPLDQYLDFRDVVLELVKNKTFLSELRMKWTEQISKGPEICDALLLEMKAFVLAVEVAHATEKPVSKSKRWVFKWLGRGSTVAGSVEDILPDLPWYAKSGIALFKEVLDLFGAKK